jgi:hypothetical protein
MILKWVVLLGLAIYFAVQKSWIFAALSVISLIPYAGLGVAIVLTIGCFWYGYHLARDRFGVSDWMEPNRESNHKQARGTSHGHEQLFH